MKDFYKSVFIKIGGADILRMLNRTPRVYFWHGVDLKPDSLVEAETISVRNFNSQLEYLKKNFEIISIDEFYRRFLGNSFTNREVVLTFDDGYKNNLLVAAPILRRMDLPFTVFISVNNVTEGKIFPTSLLRLIFYGSKINILDIPSLKIKINLNTQDDRRFFEKKINKLIKTLPHANVVTIYNELKSNISSDEYQWLLSKYKSLLPLNWQEVKEIIGYCGTIGSHCMDHICCHSGQPDTEVRSQIFKSKLLIEERLGQSCDYIAYPNGDFTDFSNSCVRSAGYKLGFSTKRNKIKPDKGQMFNVPRISLPYNYKTFQIITGLYPKG